MNIKTHYTAKELAGLPGMPGTEQNVTSRAKRENWPFQKRSGRGGGKEYPISCLPEVTREYLAGKVIKNLPVVNKEATVPATIAATVQPAKTTAQLKQWQRDIMEARVFIMRLIERTAPLVGVNKAINTIVNDASDNPELPVYMNANARKGSSRTLSYNGIIKWWMAWKKSEGNCMVLAPKDTENYLEPAWAEALLKCWSKPQKPCLTDVMEELAIIIPKNIPMPSYSQARNYLQKKLGTVERHKGRKTGTELQSLKPFRRRDTKEMFPGDAYTADGHCFDSEVAHPYHGRPFRPEITPILDVATRRCVGWSVDLAESGLAVLDALRIACETCGVPSVFYTDNGSGYKNQMMTAAGTGILHRLDITPEYSRPRNPQAHGLSERGHQTILIKAAKGLCTYIGHQMDGDAARLVHKKTRKDIKTEGKSALLIEWDDFVRYINAAIEHYNNTPHRGLPAMRDPSTRKRIHLSPNQAWHMGVERMKRELPEDQWLRTANELPDLYHPAVERTVIRGEIQFGTLSNGLPKRYFSRQLEEWHGHRVQVAFSPSDASRIWVRDLEHQRLLAVAELAGNSDHYFAPSKIEEARIKRGKGRLKRLENQVEEVRLEMYGPQPVMVEQPENVKQQVEYGRQLIEEATLAQDEEQDIPTDPRAKNYLWDELNVRVKTGEILPQKLANFYRGWQSDPYHSAWQEMKAVMEGNSDDSE